MALDDLLNDEALLRYSRQILLPRFDVAGQAALLNARVLVVGAGGLGCPVVLYLAAAGVGWLRVVDDDQVELSNLQRQIAFGMDDLGQAKAERLAARARQLNPSVKIEAWVGRLHGDVLDDEVAAVDLVVDASDNFATRFALNAACQRHARPLVSGAAIRAEGQVSVFDPRQPQSPCYQCLYPDQSDVGLTCSEAGVMAPLVGMIGATQAMETIKVLAGVGEPLVGRILLLDAWSLRWREMRLPRDPHCPACAVRGQGTESAPGR